MGERRKVQVTLTLMVGAEPWVRVEHPKGWFKVPGHTEVLQVLQGALAGWQDKPRRLIPAETYVRVPLSLLRILELRAGVELPREDDRLA